MIKKSIIQTIKYIIAFISRIQIFWVFSKLFSRIQDSRGTIFILHGKEKNSQSDISMFFFGKKDSLSYLSEIFYMGNPKIEIIETIFIWNLQRKLNYYRKNFDVMIVKTDRFFSHLLRRKGFFIVPEWIEMGMPLPENLKTYYEALGSSAKKDIQTLEKHRFSYEISNDTEKLDFFYHTMCLSYMMKRHGALALFNLFDYSGVKKNFKRGFLLLVKDGPKYVAGAVIIVRKNVMYPVYMGIRDDDLYLNKGVGAALYHFPILWGIEQHIKTINFGNTRTFLNSGDFQFKRKWGMTAMNSRIFFGIYGLMMSSRSTDKLVTLLENHPLIYTSEGTLKGLVVTQQHLTMKNMDNIWKNYFTEGFSSLSIFSPYCLDDKMKETLTVKYKGKIVLSNIMEKII
ncbi:MAG: hypothetical protein MUC80_05135 [Candidatus Thermoplasmatota archaeon]|jgi:hypothetical protein|nr:hypothetical protein [Candidatus Thermoplasmatota archaeon]